MKKGYYYALDVIFAITVVLIGIMFIIAQIDYEPDKVYTYELSNDVVNVLQNVRLSDVCSPSPTCSCTYNTLDALCNQGEIMNEDLNLLEYLGELYFRDMQPEAAGIIKEIFVDNKIIPHNYEFVILINDVSDPGNIAQLYPLVP